MRVPQMDISLLSGRRSFLGALPKAALATALCLGCDGPTDVPVPSTTELTLSFCPRSAPVWAAFKNEGSNWERVVPSGPSVTFEATEKVGVAWVTRPDASAQVLVRYATRSEHVAMSVQGRCPEDKTLSGAVSGVPSGEVAVVGMGQTEALARSLAPTFTLDSLMAGPVDLAASRGIPSGYNGGNRLDGFTPNRMIIRRAQDIPSGAAIPVLDFSSAEAFAPATSRLTILGPGPGASIFVSNALWTGTSTRTSIHWGFQVDRPVTLYSVPQSKLMPGDLHEVWVDEWRPDELLGRSVLAYFAAPADRTIAFGPYIGSPVVTTVATAPHLRMRGRVAYQSEYEHGVQFIFGSLSATSRNVHVFMSAAYRSPVRGTWEVDVPDLSGVPGFDVGWMPTESQAPHYQVEAFSGGEPSSRYIRRPRGAAGQIIRYSSRLGSTSAALQLRARGERLPAPRFSHRR